MDAFTIIAVWFTSLISGMLLMVGLTAVFTGRALINVHRIDWSIREARWLGVWWVVESIAFGAYSLNAGLTTGAHVIPLAGVGSALGLFASAPFFVVIFGGLVAQAVIEHRHLHPRRAGVP
jgi:hypothetical protein